MNNYKIKILALISVFLIIFSFNLVFAGTAQLNWDVNTEPDLAGYKIYYGTSPRTGACPPGGYPNTLDVGKTATPSAPSHTFSALTDGLTYFFSVTAYDTSGNESCFSGEVSKAITATAPTVITNLKFTPKLEGVTNTAGINFTIAIFNVGTAILVTQFSASPDATGQLTLPVTPAINSGSYDLRISSPTYLKKKMLNVSFASNAVIVLPILPAGDFNNDNVVNSLDWSLMSPQWFQPDPIADINKDGIVNTIDFSLLNKNWARVGD